MWTMGDNMRVRIVTDDFLIGRCEVAAESVEIDLMLYISSQMGLMRQRLRRRPRPISFLRKTLGTVGMVAAFSLLVYALGDAFGRAGEGGLYALPVLMIAVVYGPWFGLLGAALAFAGWWVPAMGIPDDLPDALPLLLLGAFALGAPGYRYGCRLLRRLAF